MFPKNLRPRFGPYAFVIDFVHDVDTVFGVADCGLRQYPTISVRLHGVSGAELSQRGGDELKAYTEQLLPHGAALILHTVDPIIKSERWTFERVVGSLITLSGQSVNIMIENHIRNSGFGEGIT